MRTFLKWYSIILLQIIVIHSNAQINNTEFKIDYTAGQIDVCQGSYLSEITILAKDIGLNNFEITIGMPPGVNYEAASSVIVTAPVGYNVSEANITDLSNPVFGVSNGGNWAAGDEVVFTILRTANCVAVDHSLNSGTFKEEVFINYDDNGTLKSDSDTDPTINSYQVNYGVLSILPVAPVLSTIGRTETRDIIIRQGGLGCIESFEFFVVVGDDLNNYALSYNSNALTPLLVSPNPAGMVDTLFFEVDLSVAPFTNVGNGNSCFENSEEILFQESFRVSGCENSTALYNGNWGCNSEVCQEAVEQEGVVNLSNGVPDIQLEGVTDPRLEICDTVMFTVMVTNNGSQTTPSGGSVAKDMAIIFGLNWPGAAISTPGSPQTWGSGLHNVRFWKNFTINGVPVQDSALLHPTLPQRGPASFFPPNHYTSDPDGSGGLSDVDGDGYYDDLQVGDTLLVSFEFWIKPKDNLTCGTSTMHYMGFESLNFDVSYENQCNDVMQPERVILNYTNIVRNYSIPSVFEGPIDVGDGEVFEVEFTPQFIAYSGDHPLCNGEPMLSSSYSNWTVTLDLPTGFSIGPNPQPNPLHAALNPTITQVGNQVIYTLDHYSAATFPFQLQLDCAAGPPDPETSLQVTTNYECLDDNGNVCWKSDIHCMSIELRTHCPGATCTGIITRSFSANRITPGWTDATMNTPVTLDNSGDYNLKYYFPFDTMLIESKGTISDTAVSDLFLEVSYSNIASGIDQIRLARATVEIGDVSSGNVYSFPITNLPVPTITGSDSFNITFDLSPYNEQVSSTYLYGGDTSIPGVFSMDSVKVYAYFEVAEDFPTNVQYQMTNFSGTYFTNDPSGNRVQCDTYGDRAWFEKVRMNAGNGSSQIVGCDENEFGFLFCQVAASGDNYVSSVIDEYRPPYRIDSFVISIPPTLRFTGNITLQNLQQTVTNVSSYQMNGNDLIIYTPPGWKEIDKRTTYWGRLYVGLVGICETQTNTEIPIPYEWHLTEYYYHPDPAVHKAEIRTGYRTAVFYPPTFTNQAQNPIVNGVQQIATWDVVICNTQFNADVGYNWLNIENNPNIQLLSIEEVDSGSTSPLTYAYTPYGIYVELDSLNSTECKTVRISTEYSDCDQQTIAVNHNWDCQQYPNSLADDDPSCYLTETLVLNPQPAQVQSSIINQPNVISLCSLLTYELEINSAQLANLINPYLNVITANAPGVTVNSVSFEYPAGSGNIETINPTTILDTLFYNLNSHSQVAANGGINGTSSSSIPGDRKVLVTVEVDTDCDFVSGSTLVFQVGGEEPCGARAIGDKSILISDNLEIPQALDLYDANVAILSNSLDSFCNSSASVDLQIFITGGTTAGFDTSHITLPLGASFDPATFNCTASAGVFCPTNFTVTTINGREVLQLTLPTGMTSGDILDFSFDVIADLQVFTPGDSLEIVNTTVLSNIACGNSLCSEITAQTGTGTEILNIDLALGVVAINSNAVSCYQGNDGTATITPSGGNSPFTYQWSSGSSGATATGLAVGTYTVTITDDKGCQTTDVVFVDEPSDVNTALGIREPTCNGAIDGTLSITASGGTPGYTYVWSTGDTTQQITGLVSGSYTVSITDANGCLTQAGTIINQPDVLFTSVTAVNPTCYAGYNGNATAITTGGTDPYSYLWDNNAYNQTGQTAYGLGVGTYSVTITDYSGCTTQSTVTLGQPTPLMVDVDAMDASCPGLADGSIALSTTGGAPGYNYVWGPNLGGQTSPTVTGLALGTYDVSVTDSLGCIEILSVFIDTLTCDPCVDYDICALLTMEPNHPFSTQDSDGDGVINSTECIDGTDPCDHCDFEETNLSLPITADQSDCPNLCPDLSPIMTILPGNIAGFSQVQVAIEVTELNTIDTDGSLIVVRMPSDPRLAFVWDVALTMSALKPVQNANWNYLGDNGIVHTWTYNGPNLIINGGAKSALGFHSYYDPQATDGNTTLTVTIIPFSGGECQITNNTDSERLVYFQ